MTPAIVALTKAGIEHVVHSYEHDPSAAFGIEAANKLEIAPERVFKTLIVSTGGGFAVAVIPVSTSLNFKLVAAELSSKRVVMADSSAAERVTGYLIGGISPIKQKKKLRTLIDVSAQDFETVFISAGRRGLEIELSAESLLEVTDAIFCDLTAE